MKCVICCEEEADGKYEEFGICPICGDLIEDVIAMCFRTFSELNESQKFPDFFRKQLNYIEETASWIWGWVMEKDKESAKGADDRFYKKLEMVVNWMENNIKTVEKICNEFFYSCSKCGGEISPESIKIEELHGWFKVFCKNCENLLAKCFSPKEI